MNRTAKRGVTLVHQAIIDVRAGEEPWLGFTEGIEVKRLPHNRMQFKGDYNALLELLCMRMSMSPPEADTYIEIECQR